MTRKHVTNDALDYVSVMEFGAVGDGVTDDSGAIQDAIDFANGKRPVYFETPTVAYRLNGNRQGTYNALLTYVSGTEFYGDGDSSVLRVADDYTDGGDYQVFAPASDIDTSNVKFSRFKIDGNGLNNTVIDSGANIRTARMIYVRAGTNVVIEEMTFANCPGRNAILLGNNGASPSVTDAKILNCRFTEMGAAISGNSNQNDHSTIHIQGIGGLIAGNTFSNTSAVNPASPTKTVLAIEVHGSRNTIRNNRCSNYTHFSNQVAQLFDSVGCTWENNKAWDISKLGFNLWTLNSHDHADLTIQGNTIELISDFASAAGGIFQSNLNGAVTGPIRNLRILANTVYQETMASGLSYGIFVTAVTGGAIRGNYVKNVQGTGIAVEEHTQTALNVVDLAITDNRLEDCGYSSLGSRPYAIQVISDGASLNCQHQRIRIARNQIVKSDTSVAGRGIGIVGGSAGLIEDVTVYGDNTFKNIPNAGHLVVLTTTTNHRRVYVLPRQMSIATATSPTTDVWLVGDQLLHTDVAASGTLGKVCTTAGASSSATWATATAYTVGQWIKTSGNKTLECIVAGTSHASTEPNPTTLGEHVTDNTVTWAYRHSVVAVFKTFGTVAA